MYIVPDACAVGSVVVVTEYFKLFRRPMAVCKCQRANVVFGS